MKLENIKTKESFFMYIEEYPQYSSFEFQEEKSQANVNRGGDLQNRTKLSINGDNFFYPVDEQITFKLKVGDKITMTVPAWKLQGKVSKITTWKWETEPSKIAKDDVLFIELENAKRDWAWKCLQAGKSWLFQRSASMIQNGTVISSLVDQSLNYKQYKIARRLARQYGKGVDKTRILKLILQKLIETKVTSENLAENLAEDLKEKIKAEELPSDKKIVTEKEKQSGYVLQ